MIMEKVEKQVRDVLLLSSPDVSVLCVRLCLVMYRWNVNV